MFMRSLRKLLRMKWVMLMTSPLCLTCWLATNRICPLRDLAGVTRLGVIDSSTPHDPDQTERNSHDNVLNLNFFVSGGKAQGKASCHEEAGSKKSILAQHWCFKLILYQSYLAKLSLPRWRLPSNSSSILARRMIWWTTWPKPWWMIGKMKSFLAANSK